MKFKFVMRVVILSCIFVLSIVNFIFAQTYDISKATSIRLVSYYSSNTTVDDMDTVIFGSYPQNNASGSTKEPIEWVVLDRKSDKVLLLSKYVLDCKCYNDDLKDVTWETCTLREWLNFDFLNNAFNDNEQNCIIESEIVNHRNYLFNTSGGNNTIDKVFVLSSEELKLTGTILNTDYFMHKNKLETKATNYAKHVNNYGINLNVELNTVGVGRIGDCSYWLRTPANNQSSALSVGIDGWIEGAYHKTEGYDLSQCNVDRKDIGVRPAMWVSLSGDDWQTPDGKWVGDDGLAVDTTGNVQTALGENVRIEGANVYQNLDGSIQIGGTLEEGAKVLDGWVNDTYYRNGIKVVNEWNKVMAHMIPYLKIPLIIGDFIFAMSAYFSIFVILNVHMVAL